MSSAGGSAAQGGFRFQAGVTALVAAHVLAEVGISRLDLADGGIPAGIHPESSAPVDDLLVWTRGAGRVFVNVKRTVEITKRPASALWSAVDQFVRLLVEAPRPGLPGQEWRGALDPVRDRLALAFDRNTSNRAAQASRLLARLAARAHGTSRAAVAANDAERALLTALEELIGERWQAIAGASITETELDRAFALLRLLPLDLEGSDRDAALTTLGAVLADGQDRAAAWEGLAGICTDLAIAREPARPDDLRDRLRSRGFRLQAPARFSQDIARLTEVTDQTLADLQRFSILPVEASGDAESRPTLDRACAEALLDAAERDSFLVVGEAGAGKSGALFQAASRLRERGHPVVVLAVDRYASASAAALAQELRLTHDMHDVLRHWSAERPGILFVDALDASRGGAAERAFRDLIRDVRRAALGWRVVASVRAFDLRFGAELQALFRGSPVDSRFADPSFARVAHLHVPRLAPRELDQLRDRAPRLWRAYEEAAPSFREVLSSPYNLYLLGEIVLAEGAAVDTGGLRTEIQLFDRYWSARVVGGVASAGSSVAGREEFLRRLADAMIAGRALAIDLPIGGDEGADAARLDLLAAHVLVARYPRGNGAPRDLSFAHHALFDYVVARVLLDCGSAPDLASLLRRSPEATLWVAPAALLSFRMLWDEDPTRRRFWRVALDLASGADEFAFTGMLPARVAAEFAASVEDFAPILDRLGGTPEVAAAAAFLLREAVSAVLADMKVRHPPTPGSDEPWTALIRAMVERAPADFTYPANAALLKWTEAPGQLSAGQTSDLSAAGRCLLRQLTRQPLGVDGPIASAIAAVVRTLAASGDAAVPELRALLEPDWIAMHRGRELFWLAQEATRLVAAAPSFLADLYRAAFLTPLPERGEKRNLGASRILVLTTDTRQDFGLVRHLLAEKFAAFVEASPIKASAALRDILAGYSRAQRLRDDTDAIPIRTGTTEMALIADYSRVWWPTGGDRRGHDDELKLLDGWVAGMGRAVKALPPEHDGPEAGMLVLLEARCASAWSAALQAARGHPARLGRVLLPFLQSSAALELHDVRYPAGELLRVVHPVLQPGERASCEAAILGITDANVRATLLGLLDPALITRPDARDERSRIEAIGDLPENTAPPGIEVTWRSGGDDWWFREAGADLNAEPDRTLRNLTAELERAKAPDGEVQARRAAAAATWPVVVALHGRLARSSEGNDRVRAAAWHAVGAKVAEAAATSSSTQQLNDFHDLRAILDDLIRDGSGLAPIPLADPEREKRFAAGPSWSSPAPRVEGARALMFFLRACSPPVPAELLDTARRLAVDGAPEVRLHVLQALNLLAQSAPDTMWAMFERAFGRESNDAILAAMLEALRRVCDERPDWAAEQVVELLAHREVSIERRDRLLEISVAVLLRLWLVKDNEPAGLWIMAASNDPLGSAAELRRIAGQLRPAIRQGAIPPLDPFDERVRRKCTVLFTRVAQRVAELWTAAETAGDAAALESLLQTADILAREIYFGSGAYRRAQDETEAQAPIPDENVQRRFLAEFGDVLSALAAVRHPAVAHHLLETLEAFISFEPAEVFALISTVTDGAMEAGYQFESMGQELLVRIVRRYIADHRPMLLEREDFRIALMRHLNALAAVGWPAARRLIYDLPGLLR